MFLNLKSSITNLDTDDRGSDENTAWGYLTKCVTVKTDKQWSEGQKTQREDSVSSLGSYFCITTQFIIYLHVITLFKHVVGDVLM